MAIFPTGLRSTADRQNPRSEERGGFNLELFALPSNNGQRNRHGGMAEWLKAAVLKTVSRKRDVGSNPTPSARTSRSLSENLPLSDFDRFCQSSLVKRSVRKRQLFEAVSRVLAF